MKASDIKKGMRLQKMADEFIFACLKYDFPSVLHNVMCWRGLSAGHTRRPFRNYADSELDGLKKELAAIREKYGAEELADFHF